MRIIEEEITNQDHSDFKMIKGPPNKTKQNKRNREVKNLSVGKIKKPTNRKRVCTMGLGMQL